MSNKKFNVKYPRLNRVVTEAEGEEVVSYELADDSNNLKKYEQINELVDFILDQFKDVADKIPYRTNDADPENPNTYPEAGIFVDADNYYKTISQQVTRDLKTRIDNLEAEYNANPLKIQYDQKLADLRNEYEPRIYDDNVQGDVKVALDKEYQEKKKKLAKDRNKDLDNEYHAKINPLKRDYFFIKESMPDESNPDAIKPFNIAWLWETLQQMKEYKRLTGEVPINHKKTKDCWKNIRTGLTYYLMYDPSKKLADRRFGSPMAAALNAALQHYNEYADIDREEVKLLMTITDKMGNVINKAGAFSDRWDRMEKTYKHDVNDNVEKTTEDLVSELQADIDEYTQKAKQIFADAKEQGIDLYTVDAEWKKVFDRVGAISGEIATNSKTIEVIKEFTKNAEKNRSDIEKEFAKKESELKKLNLNSGLNVNGLDGKNILKKENIDSIINDLSSELDKKNKQFTLLGEAEKEEQELNLVKGNAANKEENKKNQEENLNALLLKEIEAQMYMNTTRNIAHLGFVALNQCSYKDIDIWAKALKEGTQNYNGVANESLEAIKSAVSFVQLLYANKHYKTEDEIANDSDKLNEFNKLIEDCKKYYGDPKKIKEYEFARGNLLKEIKSANDRTFDATDIIQTEEFKKNKSLYEGYISKLNGELNATRQKISNAENALNAKKLTLPTDKKGKPITKAQLSEDIQKLSTISADIQRLKGRRDLIKDVDNRVPDLEARNIALSNELTPLQEKFNKLETAKNNRAILFNGFKELIERKTVVNKALHDAHIRRQCHYLNQDKVADTLLEFEKAKDHAKKPNHTDSESYTNMIKKLKETKIFFAGFDLDKEVAKIYCEKQPIKIRELKEAAEAYINAKEAQWRPKPSTMRKQRLRYAKSIKEFAATVLEDINKQKKDFDELLSVPEKVNPDVTQKTLFSHIRALNPKELGQYTDEFAQKEFITLAKGNIEEKPDLENILENKKDAAVGKRPSLDDDNKADKKDDLNKSFSFN